MLNGWNSKRPENQRDQKRFDDDLDGFPYAALLWPFAAALRSATLMAPSLNLLKGLAIRLRRRNWRAESIVAAYLRPRVLRPARPR